MSLVHLLIQKGKLLLNCANDAIRAGSPIIKLSHTAALKCESTKIDIRKTSSGLYFIKIDGAKSSQVLKAIVN